MFRHLTSPPLARTALLCTACAALLLAGCAGDDTPAPPTTDGDTASTYTPAPVYCADGSGALCDVMPSMIGDDPALPEKQVGYQGLSNDVTSFEEDIQTPFDNMSWQMFVALNWPLDGSSSAAWEGYARVEDVFGGGASPCSNPEGLPTFSLTAKSDGQPTGQGDGFEEASTNLPLIDGNGNFVVYERRLNDIEQQYLKNDDWDLTTLAGQQTFIEDGYSVNFTESDPVANGALGATELKMAWRVLDTAAGDDPSRYISQQALLAVDASEVRGSDKPICDKVTMGLVGFHIIQKNPELRSLLAQWIWTSFEHKDNVPLSPNACDPATESACYVKPDNPTVCTAPTDDTGTYSFFDSSCTTDSGDCPVNTGPTLVNDEKYFLWSPQQPYASAYLYGSQYGTQVTRCWQIYGLTQELNAQWQQQLADSNSVLSNYMLIGTQWGGNVEPDGTNVANGAVPAFLSNSTLETYIQTKSYGSCIVCHQGATMAYEGPDNTKYDSNFSFLLLQAE